MVLTRKRKLAKIDVEHKLTELWKRRAEMDEDNYRRELVTITNGCNISKYIAEWNRYVRWKEAVEREEARQKYFASTGGGM